LSRPSHVSLRLIANDGAIHFSIENSVHGAAEGSADTNSALGLRNVRRRLELLYPGSHSLSIHECESVYRVDLDLEPRGPHKS
jgi:two-component system, LytTR family, sensor kinase